MRKVLSQSDMTLISIALSLIFLCVSTAHALRRPKLGAFVTQYKALRPEGLNLCVLPKRLT